MSNQPRVFPAIRFRTLYGDPNFIDRNAGDHAKGGSDDSDG